MISALCSFTNGSAEPCRARSLQPAILVLSSDGSCGIGGTLSIVCRKWVSSNSARPVSLTAWCDSSQTAQMSFSSSRLSPRLRTSCGKTRFLSSHLRSRSSISTMFSTFKPILRFFIVFGRLLEAISTQNIDQLQILPLNWYPQKNFFNVQNKGYSARKPNNTLNFFGQLTNKQNTTVVSLKEMEHAIEDLPLESCLLRIALERLREPSTIPSVLDSIAWDKHFALLYP